MKMLLQHKDRKNYHTKNRKDGYGGVLLAISNQLTSTQITKAGTDLDLDTNCENVWAKISYEDNKSLYLCTYYRPPSDKGESLEQLGISLNRVLCKKTNSNIWVSGDFNLDHIHLYRMVVDSICKGSDLLPSYDMFAHTFSQFVLRSKSVPAFEICEDVIWIEIASNAPP
jgi:hypothetical protein